MPCRNLPIGAPSTRRPWSPARVTRQRDGRLQGRIPAVGRARRPAARRPAIFHHAGQLAPHRPHHLGRDLRAAHRQRRLFRQPRRFRRRDRPGTARVKRLAIMDQDGANVRYLTRGDELVLTPRFSPSSQEITYMAYGQGDPRVYLLNIDTGQREIVGNFPGMSFSPRFSPDGQSVVMSLQEGANANIFVMDLRSKATTRLTNTQAIDTVAVLFAGRRANLLRVRPRRATADLRHGGDRRPGAAHQLRRRHLHHAGLVAARRLHRLHQQPQQHVRDRRHETGRQRRAHPHRRLPQRRPDLRAERPRDHVLPRSGGTPGRRCYTVDISGRNEQRVPTPNYASDPAWSPLLS